MKPDAPPKPGIIRQRIQAFRFFSADKRQIVQPRFDGLSFNRLEPYSWELLKIDFNREKTPKNTVSFASFRDSSG
jgi:hypothetical protein